MLGFIPMNKFATVYRQSKQLDKWGQPVWKKCYTGKCFVTYDSDLRDMSGLDGYQTTLNASVYFHGFVEVTNGDKIEFTTAGGIKKNQLILDVSYFEDYTGKVVSTRVVCGAGKRN